MFNPNPPFSFPFTPTGGYTPPQSYAGSPYGSQPYSASAVPTATSSTSSGNPYDDFFNSQYGQKWNAAQESAASYARKQADATMANAKRALDTQVQQLKQQGRYQEAQIALQRGDQQIARDRLAAETQINQAKQALDEQRYGLDRAKAETDFLSGPDTMFQRADFEDALTRAGQGFGPTPYGSNGTPTPRTVADFNSIAGGPNPYGSTAPASAPPGATMQASSSDPMSGSGQMTASAQGSGQANAGGNPTDPRITAATAVMKAIPPSDPTGHDESDQAALNAIQNIFKAAKPGTLQRMRPGQQAAFMSGMKRLGWYGPDVQAELAASAPGQQSVRAA